MNIEERIKAFASLGEFLRTIKEEELQSITAAIANENPWFTAASVAMSLSTIGENLTEYSLKNWLKNYDFSTPRPRKVALILAGNIPAVGFHDIMSVLLSGHIAVIKYSSKDRYLTQFLLDKLRELAPSLGQQIIVSEELLKDFDAVIATGSDNTSRYFEYYFSKYPHIIRKNRTSVALLHGGESDDELTQLGKDVFSYFGLGCRNVSKIFVPENYQFDKLFRSWEPFKEIVNHHKYCNNYDYQKSILLINREPFLDNGFVILQPSERIVSPISVVYHESYRDMDNLRTILDAIKEKIQTIVGDAPLARVKFGDAQCPALSDYADNVDTLRFLEQLNTTG